MPRRRRACSEPAPHGEGACPPPCALRGAQRLPNGDLRPGGKAAKSRRTMYPASCSSRCRIESAQPYFGSREGVISHENSGGRQERESSAASIFYYQKELRARQSTPKYHPPPPVPASFHQYRKRVGSAYELRELTRRARAPIARGAGRGASPLQTLRHAPHVRAALEPEVVHVLGRQLVRGALGPGELRAGIAGRTRAQVPSQLLARGGEGTHT